MTNTKNRTALITGACGGLGTAIAERLCRDGYRALLLDMSEKVHAQARALNQRGFQARGVVCDITDEDEIKALFDQLDADAESVDILVNNAGISPKINGKSLTAEEVSLSEWQAVLTVNLTAPFLLSRTASPRMRERGWGRIINMASVAGRTRSMVSGAHYSASKAGLIGFSRMFASQVAKDGITVNCIAPGTIDAGLGGQLDAHMTANYKKNIPVGRIGEPEEVAAMVAYLAGEETSFITGAVFDINGGYFMP
ncbi:3-oxoacyl-ACP reductase [Pollutimonas nitritireducens]|uniref:3-oxoacyl-ACP reductase n=2 Tax=Pollutimonas nitritireducens TaxID=2045209 RepID=A0A2N4UAJ2_9BURK|nr:3-oxoacyl-ACP reductase [Pollutimonas nitritireducens]